MLRLCATLILLICAVRVLCRLPDNVFRRLTSNQTHTRFTTRATIGCRARWLERGADNGPTRKLPAFSPDDRDRFFATSRRNWDAYVMPAAGGGAG